MPNLKRLFPQLALVLALFLTRLSVPTFSQSTGMIEGTIIGRDGNPLVGALIVIERKEIKQHLEVKTNKKGQYIHAGLTPGLYRVSVNWEGKEIYYFDNTKVSLGESTKLDLNLKEKEKAAQAAAPTPEEKEVEAKIEAAKSKHETMKARFEKGREYLQAKQYDQALEEFKAAAEMDPKQYVIFASMAEAYKGLRKFEEGIQSYTQALTIFAERQKPDPQVEASYHMNMALIYALAGKMEDATAETKKAAEINPPTGSKAYFNLGATLINAGKTEEAISAFQKAIEMDPSNADAQYQLGISLMGKAQITPEGKTIPAPGTVEAFQKYLQLQPNGPYAATAKNMIEMLGATIETKFSADKEKKKK